MEAVERSGPGRRRLIEDNPRMKVLIGFGYCLVLDYSGGNVELEANPAGCGSEAGDVEVWLSLVGFVQSDFCS